MNSFKHTLLNDEPFGNVDVKAPLALKFFLLWAISFILLAFINWPNRNEPYYWDALGYVLPQSLEIYEGNLFPFLLKYDVGHPTGFFWLLALMFKVIGVSAFSGHLLVWGFGATLFSALYGMGRTLGAPPSLAIIAGILAIVHPLCWSQLQQIQIDLPMAALAVCALLSWAHKRWVFYFLFGSATVLVKFHGFLIVAGPVGSALLELLLRRQWGSWKGWKESAIAVTPLLSFIAYIALRQTVRYRELGMDPRELTIGWEALQHYYGPWTMEYWQQGPKTLKDLILRPAAHLLLLPAFVVGCLLVYRTWKDNHGRLTSTPWESSSFRMLIVTGFFVIGYLGALSQLSALLARYSLAPLVLSAPLLIAGLYTFFPRRRAVLLIGCLAAGMFCWLWKLDRAEKLPSPIALILRPVSFYANYHFEIDLTYRELLEELELSRLAIEEDAKAQGIEDPLIAAPWPLDSMLNYTLIGFVEEPYRTTHLGFWDDAGVQEADYAIVPEHNGFTPAPFPPDAFAVETEKLYQGRAGGMRVRTFAFRRE